MLGSTEVRLIVLVVTFALAAWRPLEIDQWLWRGVRDLTNGASPWPAIWVGTLAVLAECLGRWLPAWRPHLPRPRLFAALAGLVAAVGFWWARVPQWLGDYHGIDQQRIDRLWVETAEPLGVLLSTALITTGASFGWLASSLIQAESAVFGGFAIAALFLWARRQSPEWPLVFLLLASSGSIVLFFGYPEKGTPKMVALVTVYIAAAVGYFRNPSEGRVRIADLCLSLALFTHGAAMCWLPAHLWFLWRGRPWRAILVSAALLVSAGLIPLLALQTGLAVRIGPPEGNVAAPLHWWKAYCQRHCGYDFFSLEHLQDFFHALFALSPVAFLGLPQAILRASTPEERWLRGGVGMWLFLNAIWFPSFGYVGDWDIFAGAPWVLSFFVATVAVRTMAPADFRRLALVWITVHGLHTLVWWRFFQIPL